MRTTALLMVALTLAFPMRPALAETERLPAEADLKVQKTTKALEDCAAGTNARYTVYADGAWQIEWDRFRKGDLSDRERVLTCLKDRYGISSHSTAR